ncbi:MAG TPA: hypothetical protein PKZ35_18590, partial [Gammaproteobacteria bacterium]|nr:hypothetical protein [Gammaproteobacteria bacterium]
VSRIVPNIVADARWGSGRPIAILTAHDCTKGHRRLLVTGNQRIGFKAGGLAENCHGRFGKGLSRNALVAWAMRMQKMRASTP